jgi:tetratricopeptide (TPR) repeat protein
MNAGTACSTRLVQGFLVFFFSGILCAGCSSPKLEPEAVNPVADHLEKGKLAWKEAFRGGKIPSAKDLDLALKEFTEVLTYNSRSAEAYYERGKVFAVLGLYDLACDDYTQALQFRPHFPEAFLERARAYCQLKLFSRAIPDAKEAIRQSPLLGPGYTVLGKAYFFTEMPDYAEAKNALLVARRLDKDFDAENLISQAEEKLNPPPKNP